MPDYVSKAGGVGLAYVLTVEDLASISSSATVDTGSFVISGSFVNSYLTLSRGDGSQLYINLISLVPTNASTASFVTASNVWGPYGSNSVISASYSITASYVPPGGAGASPPEYGVQYNSGGFFAATSSYLFIYQSESLQQGFNVAVSSAYSHAEGHTTLTRGTSSHAEGISTATGLRVFRNKVASGFLPIDTFASLTDFFPPGGFVLVEDTNENTILQISASVHDPIGNETQITFYNPVYTTLSDFPAIIPITSNPRPISASFFDVYWSGADYSHAEGSDTITIGDYAHAEGSGSIAFDKGAHAEGLSTKAVGHYAHTEGLDTIAFESGSHAEGNLTTASADFSHTEGNRTYTVARGSHAEGYQTKTAVPGLITAAPGLNDQIWLSASYGNLTSSFLPNTELLIDTRDTEIIFGGAKPIIVVIRSSSYDNLAGTDYTVLHLFNSLSQTFFAGSVIHKIDSDSSGDFTLLPNSINPLFGLVAVTGSESHTEGYRTQTAGTYAHAEGYQTKAVGRSAHAEGQSTTAVGVSSHTEGRSTKTEGAYAHAEGHQTQVGSYRGFTCYIISGVVYVDGDTNTIQNHFNVGDRVLIDDRVGDNVLGVYVGRIKDITNGSELTIEGIGVDSFGCIIGNLDVDITTWPGDLNYSRNVSIESGNTRAFGDYSHAEGYKSQTIGDYSHAEGYLSRAGGLASHAEGSESLAYGNSSHAEGHSTKAEGQYSHAEGSGSLSYGQYSHAEGLGTIAYRDGQLAVGQYNIDSNSDDLFVIGDGADDANRRDLLRASVGVIRVSGSAIISSSLNVIGVSLVTGSNRITGSFELIGSGYVSGSMVISSSLEVIGVSLVTGSNRITGSFDLVGRGYVSGSMVISSSLNVIGVSLVTGSMQVTGGLDLVGNQTITGSLFVAGNITAQQYIVSSSVLYVTESNFSGSHMFGNTLDDTHQFTGSVFISNSLDVVGKQTVTGSLFVTGTLIANQVYITGSLTGSFFGSGSGHFNGIFSGSLYGTSSWAEQALTASFVTSSNVYGPYNGNSILSSSHGVTASFIDGGTF